MEYLMDPNKSLKYKCPECGFISPASGICPCVMETGEYVELVPVSEDFKQEGEGI